MQYFLKIGVRVGYLRFSVHKPSFASFVNTPHTLDPLCEHKLYDSLSAYLQYAQSTGPLSFYLGFF